MRVLQLMRLKREADELEQIRLVVDDQDLRLGLGAACAVRHLAHETSQRRRIGEHQPEETAAARARLVEERGAVGLGELAREEQPEPRAACPAREERLEDALGDLRADAAPRSATSR